MASENRVREWCWPFMHDWAKWHNEDIVVRAVVNGVAISDERTVTRQVRQCKRCGFQEVDSW